jgi:16S rRNA processing protein RimM
VSQASPPESFSAPSPRLTLARILRPRGNRGEVAAEILTDFPDRLKDLREVWLWDARSEPRPALVCSCWLHNRQAIFHFEGCDSISAAERLRGLQVQVPLADRLPLSAGRYYVTDLIGCAVFQGAEQLGTVREVQMTGEETPGTPLLVVATPRGDLLVPLAEEICTRIDTAGGRIDVVLPDGLRELNP